MKYDDAKVLIVDDEPLIREVLIAALEGEGYEVRGAESGEKALDVFKSYPADVVISDIAMAKLSGIDLLFHLKQVNKDVEVILITGYASVETAQAAVAGGAYRYLKKPFHNLQDVLDVVAEALELHAHKRQSKAKFKEIVYQRDALKKRLGQLETMSLISHAIGFPENVSTMVFDVAKLLSKVVPLDLIACVIEQEELIRVYVAKLKPIEKTELDNLYAELVQNSQKEIQTQMSEVEFSGTELPQKLGKLIEITFPNYSNIKGSLWLALPRERRLMQDEEELLDVTTAQMVGAFQKLQDFHLRERERMKAFFEKMIDSVIVLKENGKIALVNQATLKMLGCQDMTQVPEKLRNTTLGTMIDQYKQSRWTLAEKLEMQDGRIFSVSILPMSHPWESTTAIVLRDMTHQHILRKELERSRRLSSVGELVSGVVHEINTPLTLILGYSELLMGQDLPHRIKQDINTICQESMRCQKLIQNLLGLARQKPTEKFSFEITDLIEKVIDLKYYSLRKNNTRVERNFTDESILVKADPGQVQQVFLNLINNAQDAMNDESDKVLYITIQANDENVELSIKDAGPGINKKYLERIFDPFFTTKEAGKGSGLGLSICHRILEEHGGRIKAVNNPDKGATFTVVLPRILPEIEDDKRHGLVITSQQGMVHMLSLSLKKNNFRCRVVMNEESALRTLENKQYDIVLVDLIPQEIQKTHRLLTLLSEKYGNRAIILCYDILPSDSQKLLDSLNLSNLNKPFTLSQLENLFQEIMDDNNNTIS